MSELKHYGVKGQRWGVRRYQNEDGSLTSAGKKRYETDQKVLSGSKKLLNEASNLGTGGKSKIKNKNKSEYSKLTDEELKKRVNRLNLEQQYARLSGDEKKVRSGSEWTRQILQDSAIVVGMASSALGIYMALKKQ